MPHNHAGPLAGWELTQIAQFRKINEAGNLTRPLREDQQEYGKRVVRDDIEEGTGIS